MITVKRIAFCIYPNNTKTAKSRLEAQDSRLPLPNAKTNRHLIVVVFFHGPSLCNDLKTFLNVYEYKMQKVYIYSLMS
jgi:hypothetical protein